MMIVAVALLALCGLGHGQKIDFGSCPEVQVVQNFNASGYLGTWYEADRYFTIFEEGSRCSSATYSLNSDGTVKVVNTDISNVSGEGHIIEGYATLVGNGTQGQLDVVFPSRGDTVANYYIVGTDYNSWAAVFSCQEVVPNLVNGQFAWLLTRERNSSEEVVQAAKNAFSAQGISVDALHSVSQENCPQ